MGKLTISMAMFNGYRSLQEDNRRKTMSQNMVSGDHPLWDGWLVNGEMVTYTTYNHMWGTGKQIL